MDLKAQAARQLPPGLPRWRFPRWVLVALLGLEASGSASGWRAATSRWGQGDGHGEGWEGSRQGEKDRSAWSGNSCTTPTCSAGLGSCPERAEKPNLCGLVFFFFFIIIFFPHLFIYFGPGLAHLCVPFS